MPAELRKALEGKSFSLRYRVEKVKLFQIMTYLVVLLALYLFFQVLREVREEQVAGRERGFQNRAVICSLQRDLGIELPPACREPEITKYYDPGKPVSSSAARVALQNLAVLCEIARKEQVSGDSVRELCGTG